MDLEKLFAGSIALQRLFDALLVAIVATLLAVARIVMSAHVGFSLWDPGYLWYGVQRVLDGGVPIQDFSSYAIGRYYLVAAVLALLDVHGIVAVRAVSLGVSSFGIAVACVWVFRSIRASVSVRAAWALYLLILLWLWAFPWWKSYDAVVPMVLVAGFAWLLRDPKPARWLVCGVMVGLAALVGHNHGLYALIASLLVTAALLMHRTQLAWVKSLGLATLGIVVGFAPVLALCLFKPGFFKMFWYSAWTVLMARGATNITKPVPWPWTAHVSGVPPIDALRNVVFGLMFLAIAFFCVFGVTYVVRASRRSRTLGLPLFAACVCVAIPYLNVAFSRADVSHLAQSIAPMLIGCVAFSAARPWSRRGWHVLLVLLLPVSILIMLRHHSAYQRVTQGGWQRMEVRGDWVWAKPHTVKMVSAINQVARRCVKRGDTVLSVPAWPAIYAMLGVRNPVWSIYSVLPQPASHVAVDLADLRHYAPVVAFVNAVPVDGREDLLYSHTHPKVWAYISRHYRDASIPGAPPRLRVLVSNQSHCLQSPLVQRQ